MLGQRYDAIVVGAGHNGLCCAAYLAQAGKRVLVVERRDQIGGVTTTEEIYKGFHYSSCSYVVSLLRPWIVRELNLSRYGYDLIPLESTFTPFPDGRYLLRDGDPGNTHRQIAKFSRSDADIYPRFGREMGELSRLVQPLIDMPAPQPFSWSPAHLKEWLGLYRRFRTEGKDSIPRLIKLMTQSAVDFLSEWFEADELIGPMSVSGIIGTFLGVRSPGTAYVLLHHYMGEIDGAFRAWGLPRGGTGAVAQAIADAARAFGAEIRLEAPVQQILVEKGAATGILLEDGEEIAAGQVISSADPHHTFLSLTGSEHFDDAFIGALRRFKLRGSSAKVNLALDALPRFRCLPEEGSHLRGDITIAPGVDYLERAYDDAKYGRFSRQPFMDIVIPSLSDPSVAPPGKHVMSIFVQYAPYHLEGGPERWPGQRDRFADAVIDTLSEYIPNLRDIILHRYVVTPWDLEKKYGLTEGNIFHGELSLEQLGFLRPVANWSRYQTPVRRLWLCGSGSHPGGGIMGSPGALCARKVIKKGA